MHGGQIARAARDDASSMIAKSRPPMPVLAVVLPRKEPDLMESSPFSITQDDINDAADGEEDDADVDGEGRHRLIAQLHVLPTEAVDRVRHGLPVAHVLLVRILELHSHLSQAAALRLLRQRPIVEAPAVPVAQHVVGLPQLNEPLRGCLERERRRVGMVLLRQPPVRRLDLLHVRFC
ncbi:hypothetical protein MUK42_35509 [Musa troglodytarum]|uniref:Uncharacterized protein n=1 Tax=Musa troglodytarum TaxID=320322 RepID=A0A9E7KBF2_9LILI|nr:hypothetical protein MUK42_35509 [Musa troglodytarum]